jgi:hypothetical protein
MCKGGKIEGNSEKLIHRHAREGGNPGKPQVLNYPPSDQRKRCSTIKLLSRLRSNDVFQNIPRITPCRSRASRRIDIEHAAGFNSFAPGRGSYRPGRYQERSAPWQQSAVLQLA